MDAQKEEFLEAIKSGDAAKVEAALQSDPTLAYTQTADGVSALLLALYYGERPLAEQLAANRNDLNIFEASALGERERASALLQSDPGLANALSPDGFSPLGLASFFGQPSLVELLLEHGADPNAASQNTMRVAPLHSAVANPQPETALAIARLLVQRGAQVNAMQQGGWTPLHEVAGSNQLEAARLLLEHGANARAKNDEGLTPLDLASKNGHQAMVTLLQENPRLKGSGR